VSGFGFQGWKFGILKIAPNNLGTRYVGQAHDGQCYDIVDVLQKGIPKLFRVKFFTHDIMDH
jgi:hypothetical protein